MGILPKGILFGFTPVYALAQNDTITPHGVYFSVDGIIRQGKNLDAEILDKEHFTALKYNQEIMR